MGLFDNNPAFADPMTMQSLLARLGPIAMQQMPPPGAGFPSQTPQGAAPTSGGPMVTPGLERDFYAQQPPAQPQAAPPAGPGLLDRLGAGLGGLYNAAPMLMAMGGATMRGGLGAGLQAGAGPMAQLQAQNMQRSTLAATYQALIASGVPPAVAQAAALNPEVLKTVAPNIYQKPELKLLKNAMGEDVPYIYKATDSSLSPALPGGAGPASTTGASPQDMVAQAEKLYPGVTNRVEQLYRGEGGMPNARTNKIDGPAMQLIQQLHPDWNMNMWTEKNRMATQLSSSAPNSLGGKLNALRNAFDHLANTSDAALQKGNINGGLSFISAPLNQIRSLTTSQQDIGSTLEREATTYGGERTKFLTGAEGSESERKAFLNSLGPDSAPPQKMAGTIEGEYIQLKSALENQQQQIRDQLGEGYLQKHPIVTPKVADALQRLERNISSLRNGGSGQQPQAPQTNAATPSAAPQGLPNAKQAPDGNWYVPDPQRPGKYLKVVQ